jgi:hypothetical protein
VAAGQSSGRGGATWSAREKARGEELGWRPAWRRRMGAIRVENGAGRVAAAVSGGGLRRQRGGSSGGRQNGMACSGKASGGALRRWASSRATRGGQERQGEASGGAA